MLDHQRSLPKSGADASDLAVEQFGPCGVIVDEIDRAAVHSELAERCGAELFLVHVTIRFATTGIPYSE